MIKLLFFMTFLYGLVSCASQPKSLDFIWPTDQKSISRYFSATHDGIDITVPTGTPVYATHSGMVVNSIYSSSYGKMILIENNQWATLYAHLSQSFVHKGQKISKKQKIGLSGNSGSSYGAHLHFEIIKKKQPVNPLLYLPK